MPGKPSKESIDFRKRADECALHATTALNQRAREVWAKMEQYWRRRAAGIAAPLVPAPSPLVQIPTPLVPARTPSPAPAPAPIPTWQPTVIDLKSFEQELQIRLGALNRKAALKP